MSSDRMEVISVTDPSIDMEAMLTEKLWPKYIDGRDIKDLRFKPGMEKTAMRFVIREAPQELWDSFIRADQTSDSIQWRRALQACLVTIHNLRQRDATQLPTWEAMADGNGVVPEASLFARVPYAYLREEIGAVAFRRSFLPPWIKLDYPLPPLCREILRELVVLHVDANPSSAASSSAAPSPGAGAVPSQPSETTPQSSTPGNSTAVPTAATAAETRATDA